MCESRTCRGSHLLVLTFGQIMDTVSDIQRFSIYNLHSGESIVQRNCRCKIRTYLRLYILFSL